MLLFHIKNRNLIVLVFLSVALQIYTSSTACYSRSSHRAALWLCTNCADCCHAVVEASISPASPPARLCFSPSPAGISMRQIHTPSVFQWSLRRLERTPINTKSLSEDMVAGFFLYASASHWPSLLNTHFIFFSPQRVGRQFSSSVFYLPKC